MEIKEALDNLYICATNAKTETLEEGYYENCFYVVANKIDEVEADLYEANHRIADLLLILGDRDRMIDLMAQAIDNYDSRLEINSYRDKDEIIEAFKEAMARRDFREKKRKEFEERCKNAKD